MSEGLRFWLNRPWGVAFLVSPSKGETIRAALEDCLSDFWFDIRVEYDGAYIPLEHGSLAVFDIEPKLQAILGRRVKRDTEPFWVLQCGSKISLVERKSLNLIEE